MTTERIADHVKFAYRVPNVSGGLLTSTIEQRTDWNYEYNAKFAHTAENNGFEYALSQLRHRVPSRVDQFLAGAAAGHPAAEGHRRRPPRVDRILGGFLHFQEEIEYFGTRVLPLVREIEAAESDSIGAPLLASA